MSGVPRFIQRHPHLTVAIGRRIESVRMDGATKPVLDAWFDAYRKVIQEYKIKLLSSLRSCTYLPSSGPQRPPPPRGAVWEPIHLVPTGLNRARRGQLGALLARRGCRRAGERRATGQRGHSEQRT